MAENRYEKLVAEGDGFKNDPDAYLEENVLFRAFQDVCKIA